MQRPGNDKSVRCETLAGCIIDTAGINVTYGNRGAARLPSHSSSQETYGSSSDDKGCGPGFRSGAVDGMDGNRERFEEGSRVKSDMIR